MDVWCLGPHQEHRYIGTRGFHPQLSTKEDLDVRGISRFIVVVRVVLEGRYYSPREIPYV